MPFSRCPESAVNYASNVSFLLEPVFKRIKPAVHLSSHPPILVNENHSLLSSFICPNEKKQFVAVFAFVPYFISLKRHVSGPVKRIDVRSIDATAQIERNISNLMKKEECRENTPPVLYEFLSQMLRTFIV